MEIKIRKEETKDIRPVRGILCAAFPSDAESKLVDELRANNKAIISLVAFHEDQVLGHIMFSPVAVHPDFQAQGVSAKLIHVRFSEHGALGGVVKYTPEFAMFSV